MARIGRAEAPASAPLAPGVSPLGFVLISPGAIAVGGAAQAAALVAVDELDLHAVALLDHEIGRAHV